MLLAVGAFASAAQLEGFKTDVSKKVIDLSELQSGGPGKDGIASIDSPKFISIEAAGKWLKPQEPIIAVEGLPERREMAKRLGATHVVSPGNAHEEIMKITGGRGVDLAVECLGKQETFENCCKVTRLGGTVSSVGVYAGIPSLSLPTDGSFVHRKIVTTFCPAGSERLEFLLDLIQAGKVDPTPMLTHESSLANIVDSYDQFRHRHDGVIKIAITV